MKEDPATLGAAEQIRIEHFLDRWIFKAQASDASMPIKFARTLQLHRRGLLAWHELPHLHRPPRDSAKHKIQAMKRQAYGYCDPTFFRLKIHAIHEGIYALVG